MSDADEIAEDLTARLLEHCGVLSVTGEEAPLAEAVADRYSSLGEPVRRIGDSLVISRPGAAGSGSEGPLVLLVGHLDVVPPTGEDRDPHRTEIDGRAVVVGRGASDMKGGNVVAMRCLEDLDLRAGSPYEIVLVLYAREEGPAEDNELGRVLEEVTWLREAELAIILEPTDGRLQAGCLGGLHALLTFHGRQAHSARPWQGENALTAAGDLLTELHGTAPVPVEVGGVTFHDVITATQASTDNARNVIPGTFTVNVNYRFAPTRDLDEAERELRDHIAGRAEIQIVDRAPPAPPRLDAPLVQRLAACLDTDPAAKQAWTDVARFAAMGVPAVNYGPGLTTQAHQAGEYVPVASLVEAAGVLDRFLRGGGAD